MPTPTAADAPELPIGARTTAVDRARCALDGPTAIFRGSHMGLIASATGILLVPGESRTPGVLYAFDDTIVAAFFSETWKQKRSFRLTKSDALEELDALPRESVTIEDVVSRSDRGAWVLPISNIAKVVLSRSKFVGVVLGLSLIKIDSTHDDVKPLYARRDATESVAALLANALGDRFENRRIARART